MKTSSIPHLKSELLALSLSVTLQVLKKRAGFASGRCNPAGVSYYCGMALFTLVNLMSWRHHSGEEIVEKMRNYK